MHKMMLALLAGAMVPGAALAQPYPAHNGWDANAFWRGAPDSPRERIEFLQRRIDKGIADGSLNRREGRSARNELNNIRRTAMRMHRRDGGRLSPDQRAMIQSRLDDLSRRIHWARHNGW